MYMDFSHPNAVYLYQDARDVGTDRRLRRRIMLADTWENDYMEYVEGNPMTLCSGLSYRGRRNRLEDAQSMNALVFDLDGVGGRELRNLFLRFGAPFILPTMRKPWLMDWYCISLFLDVALYSHKRNVKSYFNALSCNLIFMWRGIP